MNNLSIWISIAALAVAIISLYISIRKFSLERKLESARKRTDLMSKLDDAIRSTKLASELCKSSIEQFSSKKCQEGWSKLNPKFIASIDALEKQHAFLKMNGGNIDSLLLENYTPDVVAQLKTAEHLQGSAKAAIEQCANCKMNVEDSKPRDIVHE